MRVLIVYEAISYFEGGSQIAVFNWLKNLKQFGIRVKLICFHESGIISISLHKLAKCYHKQQSTKKTSRNLSKNTSVLNL